jgi:transglutaminase-like putative cysteine protease
MRLRVLHETVYAYGEPASRAIQTLRLTPRGHSGQFIVRWRIDIDHDCRLDSAHDPFGNLVHSFTVEGPLDCLTITAEGEIETQDTHGVMSGQVERFPSTVFLRDTPLTASDRTIREMAASVAARAGSDRLALLHMLMGEIAGGMRFDASRTDSGTSAAEAFAIGHGVCQDFAHVMIAATRHLGIPARYVGGYLFRKDGVTKQSAGHAWAEALVDGLGWVGFDPAHDLSPTDAYIRVATGLDYLGAAPVRGTRYGGSGESLTVRVTVNQAGSPNR